MKNILTVMRKNQITKRKIKMEKKKALKLINECYFKIKEVLTWVHYGGYHKEYYNLILKEEKDHRRFRPAGLTCGLSIGEAVKLFYVQSIFEYFFSNRTLSAKDYLSVRKSHFFCLFSCL
jgi:hypothetical protein